MLVLLMRQARVLSCLDGLAAEYNARQCGNTSRICRKGILKVMETLQELMQTQKEMNKGSASAEHCKQSPDPKDCLQCWDV